MENEDKRERREEAAEERKREEAREAVEEASQEEIRNFAETTPEMGPNSFWGQSGTWWVIGIAGILIIFLVIWVCFFS